MKILYLDCQMGAAGDMLSAALLDLLAEQRAMDGQRKESQIRSLIEELNGLGIPQVHFLSENTKKCGIMGLHLKVLVDGVEEGTMYLEHPEDLGHNQTHSKEPDHREHQDHPHSRTLAEIRQIIQDMTISPRVRDRVCQVYDRLAAAESKAHGLPVAEVHFHEVGMLDAIADISAACYLLDVLDVDQVLSSPVRTGFGHVHAAHGIMDIPAPATAYLLEGIPHFSGEIEGEMCTPTGAALLGELVDRFVDQVQSREVCKGYGMGYKDFPEPNCIRASLVVSDGATAINVDPAHRNHSEPKQGCIPGTCVQGQYITKLECNLDDMTGEELGLAMDEILLAGARDVFYTPIQMKKNRPGILLTVLVRESEKDAVIGSIFTHTKTIGIREDVMKRYVLERECETVETEFGPVSRKISRGYGVEKWKWEYEDLKRIVKETGLSLDEIKKRL